MTTPNALLSVKIARNVNLVNLNVFLTINITLNNPFP